MLARQCWLHHKATLMALTSCLASSSSSSSRLGQVVQSTLPGRRHAASSSSSSISDAQQQQQQQQYVQRTVPPMRMHKRQVTALERAAAIGLEALQDADKRRRQRARLPPLAAADALQPAVDPQQQQQQQQEQQQQSQQEQQRPKKRVGALQRVPVISPAEELAASALKRSLRVMPGAGIKNEAEKERSRAAKQLDTHMKELSVPLSKWLRSFPPMAALHPFEAALLDLTIGAATYASVLGKVDTLRKALQEVGKSSANRAAKAANKKAATAAAEEGSAVLSSVFAKGSKALDDLKKVSRALRTLPYVEPTLPTLALVGAPNVGKSSLVRVLSSGVPEVCNYPFTTRSIKMGHFYVDAARHQVMDTPGLLQRPDDFRNKMELLTLAALSHLPSSVLFVADLTEGCGTSVADQWAIRAELKARFPHKPWVDVLSKADLLQDVWSSVEQQPGQQQPEQLLEVQTAVEFAAALPAAVRVSSLTEVGLPQLQESIVLTLRSRAAQEQLEEAAAADAAAAAEEEAQAAAQAALVPPRT